MRRAVASDAEINRVRSFLRPVASFSSHHTGLGVKSSRFHCFHALLKSWNHSLVSGCCFLNCVESAPTNQPSTIEFYIRSKPIRLPSQESSDFKTAHSGYVNSDWNALYKMLLRVSKGVCLWGILSWRVSSYSCEKGGYDQEGFSRGGREVMSGYGCIALLRRIRCERFLTVYRHRRLATVAPN